ncbi:MAG: type II toxin-antitoxin system VapC family toxin [Rhodospirillaceae bacterium]|nr:type II toxin-antitoxin system VapC family toxin [Rhodospirillaceae bacterium]
MAYLIDTNVVSETLKPRPEPQVIEWIGGQIPNDLFLSSISLGELVRGARRVRDKAKRVRFEAWINRDLCTQFRGRILPLDHRSAVIWGEIMGDGDRTGRPKPMADAQIAAVALAHDLTLVTRNIGDFAGMGMALFNPWASA